LAVRRHADANHAEERNSLADPRPIARAWGIMR
jgi:hypothetical protein